MVKLSAVTKTNNLTTATINAIKGRVAEAKSLQLEEDARILAEEKSREEERAKIREEERIKAEEKIAKIAEQVNSPYENPVQANIPEMKENFNDVTGEVYSDVNENKNISSTIVKISVEFEVDISKIPHITDEKLIDVLYKKLHKADINNAKIMHLQRF